MVVLPAFALKKRASRTPVPRRFRWETPTTTQADTAPRLEDFRPRKALSLTGLLPPVNDDPSGDFPQNNFSGL
jgi:hypothetical protein